MTRPLRLLTAACMSHRGRVREYNEDVAVADARAGLLLVADGIGGHRGGGVASKLVGRRLPILLRERLHAVTEPGAVRVALADALRAVSEEVLRAGRRSASRSGMGTTAVVALVRGGTAYVANLGDSRAYLLRKGRALRQLSEDHSVAAMLARRGTLSLEQSRSHPLRAMLSRYVGMPELVEPFVTSVSLAAGDRLLCCSDGLTTMLEDDDIGALLAARPTAREACEELVSQANLSGGMDNIGVAVGDVGEPKKRRAPAR